LILQAEGDKQAAITRAEGEKQASVTRSEGEKESAILAADGAAQARLKAAAADAQAITHISQAMGGTTEQTTQYLITSRYIESLRDMTRTQNSKVIFMPMETATLLSSIGSIKEMLSETGEKPEQLPATPRSPRELGR
jgi:regulator of protease activity HflC (stomatin/prohibitin superfamily)